MTMNKIGIQNNRVKIKLRLYILGTDGAGVLEISFPDGFVLSVPLKARHIKLLNIQNNALIEDRDLEYEPARGWLTNEQIASIYDREYPHNLVPGVNVFSVYRSQINKAIKKKISKLYPTREIPSVFCSEKNVGTRLVSEIEIVDRRLRGTC
ncbi:hypothetical protein AYK24_07260 [Thermoplasmatales archaeon SG8-52-4]|nr:MAG: hypothetical protein AYK24_07260 [Thermoplasmatales archaeon SG8-52-4]